MGTFETSLKQFLETRSHELAAQPSPETFNLLVEHLALFLQSENTQVQSLTLHWIVEQLLHPLKGLREYGPELLSLIRPFKAFWLAEPILTLLHQPETSLEKRALLVWLSELDYPSAAERKALIQRLVHRTLTQNDLLPELLLVLLKFDTVQTEVTDWVLQQFPYDTDEKNRRMIHFLGATGRYRVTNPLILFAKEFPQFLRPVMRALQDFDFENVDLFYLGCLEQPYMEDTMALLCAIKQVRQRNLKRAITALEALFPFENHAASLVNRTINGEIALTLASFGCVNWAREKLLPDILLNGFQRRYLQAIERLELLAARPLIQAALSVPETAAIKIIQEEARRIHQRMMQLEPMVL